MLKYVAKEIASVATNITGYAIIITDDKGIVIGADSENIKRLLAGKESKLSFKKKAPAEETKQDKED